MVETPSLTICRTGWITSVKQIKAVGSIPGMMLDVDPEDVAPDAAVADVEEEDATAVAEEF